MTSIPLLKPSIILLGAMLSAVTAISPSKAEYFRHLTIGDGLSQPSVMVITQDKLGRMWLGTREGVNIYDGVSISAYKGWVSSGSDGRRIWIGNEVNSIVTDSIGDVFLHIDDDIVKYDINEGTFTLLGTHGNIKALAANKGEIVYAAGDSVFVKGPHDGHAKLAFMITPAKSLTHLTVDDYSLYASTPAGMHVFDRNTRKHRILLTEEEIYSSFIGSDGTLWISAMRKGLYRYGRQDSIPVLVSTPAASDRVMGASQCRRSMEDQHGNIWYGSFNGLFRFQPSTGITKNIKIPLNLGGMTHSSVFGMHCDRKGNLWVGTYYGGVSYFHPDNDKYLNFNYHGFGTEDLSNSLVKDMTVDSNGNIWFATDGAGIGCLDQNWNVVRHLSTGTDHTLRQNNVRSLEYDPATDRLFIGTHLGGLSIYDIGRQSIRNLIDEPGYQSVPGNVIHEMKLRDGKLFITSRAGLSWMDTATGEVRMIESSIKPRAFDFDDKGNIICTEPVLHNLYIIEDPTSDNPRTSIFFHPDARLMPSYLCSTGSGILVATLGNGLLFFPSGSNKPQYINTSNSRLPDDYCYAISPGEGGEVYVLTESNVARLVMADRSVQSVSFSDFFPESHIINECALLSVDDDILVGSTKGITRLTRDDFLSDGAAETPPEIFFSRLRMQNKDISPGDGSGILTKALPSAEKITLPSSDNSFSIIVGVSDYLATNRNHPIEYRMDGIDSRWQTAPGNELSFRNLPVGSYKLRARLAEGKEISLRVIVPAPWYRTWWACLIYCMIFSAAVWWILHKTLVAHRLNASLAKEKTERAQSERLNHERFVFFTNISHEFQTPLTLIISYIDNLLARYKRHPRLAESLLRVRAHTEHMSYLVTQLLEFRKLQQNQQVLRIGLHDANEILRETATRFCDYSGRRGITFAINTADEPVTGAFDRDLLDRVLVNLLSNAFKHTHAGGEISCSVRKDESGNAVFEVKDNGHGIPEKDLPFIFDRFYNGTADRQKGLPADHHSTGIGLAFAKSIVDKHHGSIAVESREGKGSTFRVVIPGSIDVFANDENVTFNATHPDTPSKAETCETAIDEDTREKDSEDQQGEQQRPLLLIVEDNDELRENLVEFFSSYFRTAEAEDGETGLARTRELSPDIIISDVLMPRLNGTEMCRIIKADIDLCHIPVILLTALDTSESRLEGLNTNADDYITKPFETTLLLARIDNLLRLRRILKRQFERQPIAEVDMSIVNPLDRDILTRATEAIEKHLDDEEFDIPALCREIGVSRTLFFNKFKALTGMTPNAFILNFRLKHAAALLTAQPHLSITEISERSGFATAIYFSRCFKKQFGVSPMAYRKDPGRSEESGDDGP